MFVNAGWKDTKKALKKYKMPFDASLLCRTDLSIASILHNVDKHL